MNLTKILLLQALAVLAAASLYAVVANATPLRELSTPYTPQAGASAQGVDADSTAITAGDRTGAVTLAHAATAPYGPQKGVKP